jgi:hypothetical protein
LQFSSSSSFSSPSCLYQVIFINCSSSKDANFIQIHQIWLQDIFNPFTSMTNIDFLGTNKHILKQFYIYSKCRFLGNKARHTQPIYIYNNHRFLRNKK